MEGFSFCGVSIGELGLTYAPELNNTYIYDAHQYQVNDQTFAGHHGGYFYGTTVKPKDFTLRCFFQDKYINNGTLANIGAFFHRGRTGKLVFQQRDWMYYQATVINVDFSQLFSAYNGLVTITMRAYYPFARCDFLALPKSGFAKSDLANNTAMMLPEQTPDPYIINIQKQDEQTQPLTKRQQILLYNAGTQTANTALSIAGDVGDGVRITNKTTNQSCLILGITKSITSDVSKYLLCDSLNGKVVISNGTTSQLNFLYHSQGFIDLAPAGYVKRNVYVKASVGSNKIYSYNTFDDSCIGKYIYIHSDSNEQKAGKWFKIASIVDASNAMLEQSVSIQGYDNSKAIIGLSNIVTMNQIIVQPLSSMSLTRLVFDYKPTFK